jgi:2-haloacid dehalogenase
MLETALLLPQGRRSMSNRLHATALSRRSILKTLASPVALATMSPFTQTLGTTAQQQRMPRIIVFDVNETLLDVDALRPHFVRAFGDQLVLREWFSTVLLYSEVASLAGPYSDFGAIGAAALDMTANSRGVSLSPEDRTRILSGMRTLPAHPDAREGLRRLKNAGFRTVTLTNSAAAAVEQQLGNAGLSEFFERSFSVDAVRRFKPAPEPYRYVARELAVDPGALRMVAAHAWDIVGAMQAGWAAAFVARPGKVLYPLAPAPDIVAPDLREIAERIIAIDNPPR